MKLLFCHDHVFCQCDGKYYSPGKLDREKFDFYFRFFDSIIVVGRAKERDAVPANYYRTDVNSVTVVPFPNLASVDGLKQRRHATKLLKELMNNVDCVIARIPSEIGLLAIKVATKLGKKLIIEVVASGGDCLRHRGDVLGKIYGPILDYRVRRALDKQANVIYVTNEYLQRCYPSLSRIGVSDVRIDSVDGAKAYPQGSWRIGIVGNPDLELKGVHVAVAAVARLRSQGVDVSLSVVGGSGERFIQERGPLPAHIVFEGVISSRDEMAEWFRSLSLYVQPSFTEGLPRSLIEAMSFGIPCIGSKVGGIPELLDGNAMFRPGAVSEVEQCIRRLLDDREYARLASHSETKAMEFLRDRLSHRRSSFYSNALVCS